MDGSREFFEYTSGRWIYNESLRLAERRFPFNADELQKVAARSINRPKTDIESFRKLAEGGFNRVFEITMNNGTQILARLPYPTTSPERLVVASEVATLDLVRAHGIPVPQVLDYSAEPDNSVGARYIIMEKLPGTPIGDVWFKLSEQQRLKVILGIVKLEAKLFNIELSASGSIYHSRDLPPNTPRTDIPIQGDIHDLCVGPDVALRWWFAERALLKVDRGPASHPSDVLRNVAEKEIAWLRKHAQPRLPFERAYRETLEFQKSQPGEHIETLEKYLKIAPYLVPKDERLSRPILRHPDLQPNNIFVSDSFDIVGIIDWQHCSVLPLFLTAGIPNYFQNYHDEDSLRLVPPKLPENLSEMDEDEQAAAQEQYRRRHLHFFYVGLTQKYNEPHFRALEQGSDLLKRKVFTHAGDPWEGNSVNLKADLVHVTENWQELTRSEDDVVPPCPISFSEREAEETLKLEEQLEDVDTQLERVRGAIGIGVDGWTSNEAYESAVAQAAYLKGRGLEFAESDFEREMTLLHWPFDDHDEDE